MSAGGFASEVIAELRSLKPDVGTLVIDAQKERAAVGIQLENGVKGNGPSVDVRPKSNPTFAETVFGDVNPVLGSIGALLGLSIILALLLMARNATVRRGSRSEYEWDEYSDYLDEDEEELIDDDADLNLTEPIQESAPANSAAAATTGQAASTDGWTQGSDGVWWWQNQQDHRIHII